MNISNTNNLVDAELQGNKKSPKVYEQRCRLCNIPYMGKTNFFDHLIGKRHIKNRKFKKNSQSLERTLCIKGLPAGSFFAVFNCFWPYGVADVTEVDAHFFIEFDTLEEAQKAAEDKHLLNGQELDISFKNVNKCVVATKMAKNKSKGNMSSKKEDDQILFSSRLAEVMDKIVDENSIDFTIQQLIDEIELKQQDIQERFKVRSSLEKFLQQMFPSAQTFIFGSSINSLGFVGCDVDMFANLGVNPWAFGTKQEMEQKAAKLTNDIAREIRRKRRGYDVVPIARARVPIVKFKDYITGIDVDLSFRSPMPIYNSSLIKLYTKTHGIVRPYLMLLRYWGKLQDVVGGMKPTILLTNYCYTMLMLFWIMHRNSPIIPSVSELKFKLYYDNPMMYSPGYANIINGWDCSFSENIHEWTIRHHETTIISLAEEFFEFYGKFDASLWVISPLIGHILSKRHLESQDRYNLPPILLPYCNVARFPTNTPFCVQDPFEHNHNIARGLNEHSLMVFQYKCRQAAETCRLIKQKKAPLSWLFKPIKVVDAELKHVNKCDQVINIDGHKDNVPVVFVNDNDDKNDESISVLFESSTESKRLEEMASCSSSTENQPESNVASNIQSSQHSIQPGDSANEILKRNNEEEIIHGHSSHFVAVMGHGVETNITSESINDDFSDVEVIENCSKHSKSFELVTIDSASSDSLEGESDIETSKHIVIDEVNEVKTNIECIVMDDSIQEISSKLPPTFIGSVECSSGEFSKSLGMEILTPVLEEFKCDFCFNERQEFSIDINGNINVLKGKLMTSHLRENKVLELIKFVLSNCLMCHIEDCLEVKENENSLKRKSVSMDDSESLHRYSSKLFKNESGNASKVLSDYTHLFRIKCTHIQFPWEKRRITAKKLSRGKNSLLCYEKTLSDRLVKKVKDETMRNMKSYIDIYKKTLSPTNFCVTINDSTIGPRSKKTSVHNLLKHFFELFSRIVKDAFVDTSRCIKLCP